MESSYGLPHRLWFFIVLQLIVIGNLGNIHVVSCVLKQFFRDNPETIFPTELISIIVECPLNHIPTFLKNVLFPKLDEGVIELFSFLFQTLYLVHSSCDKNKMPASNLAIVWTPNFLKGDWIHLPLDIFRAIVQACIENYMIFHKTNHGR